MAFNNVFARKICVLSAAILLVFSCRCAAIDTSEELLSLLNLTPETATQSKITSLLGQPMRVEATKKRTTWYYTHGNTNLSLSWGAKSPALEKFSFTCDVAKKETFDNRLQGKLQSGATDILQALKLLGTPKDMTIKKATQEIHYAYAHNVLRLFFRNKVLVDYCLY